MEKNIFDLNTYHQVWHKLNHDERNIPLRCITKPVHLSVFDCIPSTNTKLWQLIERGVECPVGAIALQQTAGKGQWGHSWVSTLGGLYLSVGLALDLEIANYPHLVMATAWGIATVLRYYQLPVTIKWSNDLILNQRKLGGIKIETRNEQNKIIKAAVGVGINWRNYVPEPGISLKTYDQARNIKSIGSLAELSAIAAYGILFGYKYYLAVGIESLLAQYLEILNSLGRQVNFNGCPGEAVGVTPEGKLIVKLRSPGATTKVAISPGQISLGYK